MIGEDEFRRPAFGTAWRATAEVAPSAPMTLRARTFASCASPELSPFAIGDDGRAISGAGKAFESTGAADRAGLPRALAQPLSKTSRSTMPTKPPSIGMSTRLPDGETILAHVDAGDEQMGRDIEIANQARRNGAAAGFYASRPIEQKHLAAAAGEIMRGGCAGRTAADDDDIKVFQASSMPLTIALRRQPVGAATEACLRGLIRATAFGTRPRSFARR